MIEQLSWYIAKLARDKRITKISDIKGLTYCQAMHHAPEVYSDFTEYKPLAMGTGFGMKYNTAFIEGEICFPAELVKNEDYEDYLFISFSGTHGCLYVDGVPYHGVDDNRDRMPIKSEWAGQTKKIKIEVYGAGCINHAYIGRVDKVLERFAIDLQLCNDWYRYDSTHVSEETLRTRKLVGMAFDKSILNLDMYKTGEELHAAVAEADRVLREELIKIGDKDPHTHFSMVASTHIDVAWLWRFKDTVRKCPHSFSNMLRLMDEFPRFTFASSQVRLLDYTKTYYPELFEEIKDRAKDGRWENVGPMWVESDCNITSGESMARQMLYGVKFLEKEFGASPRLAWLPDTFGFQSNLPQLFKKSGTEYFYTFKVHWQDTVRFPYGDFKWKGIDGSEIIVAAPVNPTGCYNGNPNPEQLLETKKNFSSDAEVDRILFPYGIGDGGGGATREMIEYAQRLESFPGIPECEMTTATKYFESLEADADKLHTWYGELYIQTHRGTMTTQGFMKKSNRRIENLFLQLEKLAVLASLSGAKPDWAELHEAWKDALTLQFHDVLPGTSIHVVYDDCREIYKSVFERADRFMASCGISSEFDPEKGLQVVNTLNWKRNVLSKCAVDPQKAQNGVKIMCRGQELASVYDAEKAEVLFLATDVPAMGFADCELVYGEKTSARKMQVCLDGNGICLENENYAANIDSCGRIVYLYDKLENKKVLSAPGNDIRTFLDGPNDEAAWNLYEQYKDREVQLFCENSVCIKENSDLRTVIGVHRAGEKVDIQQDIVFYHDSKRIDFKTDIDWHEKGKVMRVYFPTTLNAPYYTSETGFGALKRPTVNSTVFERQKFEVAAHRWIDLSECDYGVALLNDCKYGHDVQYNNIGMTLLRSPAFPDEEADMGHHSLTYSLLPHRDGWEKAGVARAGIELNAESHCLSAIGKCRFVTGLFTCECPNLVVDTVKKAEDSDEILVRIYEANGASGTAALKVGTALSAWESDIVEHKTGEVSIENGELKFDYTPYEIKTYLISLK